MDAPTLTPNEVSGIAGLAVRHIRRAMDSGLLGDAVTRNGRGRRLRRDALAALWITHALQTLDPPEARRRLVRQVLDHPETEELHEGIHTIEVARFRVAARRGLARLARARAAVTSDPEIQGGEPCFRGTRIPVHQVAEMISNGDHPTELHEDWPHLPLDGVAPVSWTPNFFGGGVPDEHEEAAAVRGGAPGAAGGAGAFGPESGGSGAGVRADGGDHPRLGAGGGRG